MMAAVSERTKQFIQTPVKPNQLPLLIECPRKSRQSDRIHVVHESRPIWYQTPFSNPVPRTGIALSRAVPHNGNR